MLSELLKRILGRRESSIKPVHSFVESTVQFGDTVRVRADPVTEDRGLSGRTGTVYGQTTPSVTGVEVFGTSAKDYAINVSLEGLDGTYWFAEELLELLDRGAGMVVRVEGTDIGFARDESGEWKEL